MRSGSEYPAFDRAIKWARDAAPAVKVVAFAAGDLWNHKMEQKRSD